MGKLHAIIVGCNYRGSPHPNLNMLTGAEGDARSMRAFLNSTPVPNGTLGSVTSRSIATTNGTAAVSEATSELFNLAPVSYTHLTLPTICSV